MKRKRLKITIYIILVVAILLFLSYKILYNVLAPKIFDYVVGRNPEALVKIEQSVEADKEIKTEEDKEKETEEDKTEPSENEQTNSSTKKDDNKLYSTSTSIGTLTSADLARVIKAISPADKTRIISICKSVVSASDMPRFARMATSGMQGDDYAFAESYLRARLSLSQKVEILGIVKKYLGR